MRKGNWRFAVENSIDEGHARYLHRTSIWMLFTCLPAWSQKTRMVPSEDGKWIKRERDAMIPVDEFPVVGTWPRRRWWHWHTRRGETGVFRAALPCVQRIGQHKWVEFEFFVPSDENTHISLLTSVIHARGLKALMHHVRFWLYRRWFYFGHFNSQDVKMIQAMEIPPARLYRPDISITAWRKWCQERARRTRAELEQPASGPNGRQRASAEAEVAH
jgi:phenylpropionate dioxygenase-like ring-hydroxylating dioxygenase large terminal subunit